MHSLHVLKEAFHHTPWQTFAAIVAGIALIMGLALALYPGVYTLSKSYVVLAQWIPSAKLLGSGVILAALAVLLGIHRPIGLHGLMLVFLFHLLVAVTSFLAVRLSGGTALYCGFALLSFYGFLRSGGIRYREP